MSQKSRPTVYLIFNPSSRQYFTHYRETWTPFAEYATEYHSFTSARLMGNELGREMEVRLEVVKTEEI